MITMMICGNVGRDPQLKYTQSGKAVCDFTVASTERWTDKNTNEKREKTTWVKCVAWGPLAEVMNNHVKKGKYMIFTGRPEAESWIKQDGTAASTLVMTIENFEFGPRREGEGNGGGYDAGGAPNETTDQNDIPF